MNNVTKLLNFNLVKIQYGMGSLDRQSSNPIPESTTTKTYSKFLTNKKLVFSLLLVLNLQINDTPIWGEQNWILCYITSCNNTVKHSLL